MDLILIEKSTMKPNIIRRQLLYSINKTLNNENYHEDILMVVQRAFSSFWNLKIQH